MNSTRTYRDIELELISKGYQLQKPSLVFVDGVATHTFACGDKFAVVYFLGLGRGYDVAFL